MIHPIILSGGSGTRLWPLSRALYPKQLQPLITDHSVLQDTVRRASGPGFAAPTVICNEDHRFIIAEQLRAIAIEDFEIVLEPEARNTAAAVAVAAITTIRVNPDAILLILPSDHSIADDEGFAAIVAQGAKLSADGYLVTFGMKPDRPETGFGYIECGAPIGSDDDCFEISRFVEKPGLAKAEECLASGRYFWNSGMFMCKAHVLYNEMKVHCPALVELCEMAVADARQDLDFTRLAAEPFRNVNSISFDHAVMEKTDIGAMVPAEIAWSDIGSWKALWEISGKTEDDNVAHGDVLSIDNRQSYLRSDGPLVAAIGLDNLIVVAMDDVVLVVPKDRAQDIKSATEELARLGRPELSGHNRVYRPWGSFQELDSNEGYKVKRLTILPGARLSLQMHEQRAEHWVVVSGTATVTRGTETSDLQANQSTYIPVGVQHCIANNGEEDLHIIEVQTGGYLGEDDIIRIDDVYGRR